MKFELILPESEEADILRRWRNDPQALEMSCHYRQEKTIDQFFPEFIRSYYSMPNLPPLFAVKDSSKVGALYFSPYRNGSEISIIVAPAFRRQGIAHEMLLKIEPFLKRQGVQTIYARIKDQNIASIKVFQKAGYQIIDKGIFFTFEKQLKESKKNPVFVIAEVGSNWVGKSQKKSVEQAFELIEKAKEAGANAVKFQMFRAKDVYILNAGLSSYLQKNGIEDDIQHLFEKLEMPDEMVPLLFEHCKKLDIELMASVFSERDLKVIDPFVKRHKIASYENTHIPLIARTAQTKKPLILSTGASTIEDIDSAINAFYEAGGTDITLLQCTAKYPADPKAIHLRVIPWLTQRFQVSIGLSDHSLHPFSAPLGAIAQGAAIIEKHFTLNKALEGPDQSYAIEPKEFKQMVLAIRELEEMMGSSLKSIDPSEQELFLFAKRGIQALQDISPGEILRLGTNIAILRPGVKLKGLHPKFLPDIINKKAKRPILQGEGIQWEDI